MAKEKDKKAKKDDADDKAAKDKDAEEEGKAEGEEKAEGEGGDGEGKKKKIGPKQLIMFGGGGVALLITLAAGLYFSGVVKFGEEKTAEADAHGEAPKEEKKEPAEVGVFYDLGEILVNLQGDGRRVNYLKIKVSVELADEKDKALFDKVKPRIMDNFQVYLRELRVDDLRGSAGIYRLREELLMRVTEAAYPAKVRDVLFQEMLVQ